MAFGFQFLDEFHRAAFALFFGLEGRALAGVFEHRQVMQGNIGAAPGVRCGRQVIGIGFTGHFENRHGDSAGHLGAVGEPLGISPALHDVFGVGIARLGFVGDVVKEVKHQQGLFERLRGHGSHLSVVQQVNQRLDVVAAHHGAQQLGGFGLGDQTHHQVAVGYSREKRRFDFGCIVHAGGHAVGKHVHQVLGITGAGCFDQLDQRGGLLGVQRQRGNAQGCAFGDMAAVCI